MKVFNRVYFTAFLTGGVAGLLLATVQQFTIVPMIMEAETYVVPGNAGQHSVVDDQDGEEGRAPEDGAEQTFHTVLTVALSNAIILIILGLISAYLSCKINKLSDLEIRVMAELEEQY